MYAAVGGKNGPNRMPSWCRVMLGEKKERDEIIAAPPKGKGPNLVIRYRLPRSEAAAGSEVIASIGIHGGGEVSNTGKGRQFQLKCKEAFQYLLARPMEEEVSLPALGGKPHKFDLATHERDVVVECKAFTWTSGGHVPAAKVTTLREAVQFLRSTLATSEPFLVISKASLPERTETLGQYL